MSPVFTLSPVETGMEATTPSFGALMGISIFMASMTRISSSALTAVPGWAVTRRIRPGTGAVIWVSPADPVAAAGAAAAMPSATEKS